MASNRLSKISMQLDAVELIRAARSIYGMSYKELSSIVEIPESILCRYANGDLLPSIETAEKIISRLGGLLDISEVVRRLVRFSGGYVDLTPVLTSPYVLRLYARHIEAVFSDMGITKVLTAATDGIPLSVMASYALRCELAIAKQYRDVAADDFYEVTYIADSPPRKVSLYLPANMLGRGDKVLIVDDIARTGKTLNALATLVEEAGAELVGVSVLVSVGSLWIEQVRKFGVKKIDVITSINAQ